MHVCEACGLRLSEHALRCPRCGHSVLVSPEPAVKSAPTLRSSDAGRPPVPVTATMADARATGRGAPDAVPVTPASPEWDPDETMRLLPAYSSGRNTKNTIALVALAVSLVAAVSSLAWLIGQSVGGGRPVSRPPARSASPTALSTSVPRNATVCTHEMARSSNTNCTVGTRVLTAVRTLGTDVPDTFRVTIAHPQTRKNATFVCAMKGWIECTGSSDVIIYVRRLV